MKRILILVLTLALLLSGAAWGEEIERPAAEYLSGQDSSSYYVMKMARTAGDDYTALIPYSTDNPNGQFYGADNGAQLLLAYRAYVEPETGVGPSYYEIVYDRAIVFHKK